MIKFEQETNNDINELIPMIKSLDASNADQFKDQIRLNLNYSDCLVVNLKNVEFIDSSGLGALIWLLRENESQGRTMKLCCLKKPVIMLLEIVRMHKVFEIYTDKSEAIKSWKM
jgi:anti-anti-sigma factor